MPILPDFSKARFTPGAPVDNRYFPLNPGTVAAFSATTAAGDTVEGNDVFVTSLKNNVLGVQTFVVRDTVYDEDILAEDTIDFYAQDTRGNVWYFGEKVINYEYDDDGNFLGSNSGGAWLAGENGALPGWIMAAHPVKGLSYFNEFAPGVALDESLVLSRHARIETDLGRFTTLKTLDTSQLSPGVREFKYYAPGIGLVREDEDLDANDNPGAINALRDVVSGATPLPTENTEALEAEDFVSDGSTRWITIVSGNSELNNSVGYYTFDLTSGVIGEGHILFDATADLDPGDALSIHVAEDQGIGLFFVPDGAELGVDLSDFEDGGLFFKNLLTDGPALLSDGMAPIVINADGDPLPIPMFHAMGANKGSNLLNPGLGLQAVEWEFSEDEGDEEEVTVIGFEDLRRTQEDYDGDFDDLLIAFSDTQIDASEFAPPPREEPRAAPSIEAEIDHALDVPMLRAFELAMLSHEQIA